MRSKSGARNWRLRREKSTWRRDKRRSLPLRPNWSKSNRMKWMLSKRSSRRTWTRGWSSGRLSITSCFKDIRTWRKKSKTSRTLRESSSKRLSRTRTRDHRLLAARAWWPREWAQECSNLRFNQRSKRSPPVTSSATRRPDHPTHEPNIKIKIYYELKKVRALFSN